MRCSAGLARGHGRGQSIWATTCSSSPGGILQAQPRRRRVGQAGNQRRWSWDALQSGTHLAASAARTWCHSGESGLGRAHHAEVSGDERGSPAAGADRGIDPGQDDLRSAPGDCRAVPGRPCAVSGQSRPGWPPARLAGHTLELGGRPGSRRWNWRCLASSPSASLLGEHVAIMMPNRTERRAGRFRRRARRMGSRSLPYATLAASRASGLRGRGLRARIAVLHGADQLARWQPACWPDCPHSARSSSGTRACPAGEPYLTLGRSSSRWAVSGWLRGPGAG